MAKEKTRAARSASPVRPSEKQEIHEQEAQEEEEGEAEERINLWTHPSLLTAG
jgi:hypothetical protein